MSDNTDYFVIDHNDSEPQKPDKRKEPTIEKYGWAQIAADDRDFNEALEKAFRPPNPPLTESALQPINSFDRTRQELAEQISALRDPPRLLGMSKNPQLANVYSRAWRDCFESVMKVLRAQE